MSCRLLILSPTLVKWHGPGANNNTAVDNNIDVDAELARQLAAEDRRSNNRVNR